MKIKKKMFRSVASLILMSASFQLISAVTRNIDCQRPPQLVDPANCCLDGGRDEVTEACAQRMGITSQSSDTPPTVQTATCLAECILTESKYMLKPEILDLEAIKSDLHTKFPNDTIYADTMAEAFEKCQPSAQKKLKAFKNIPLGTVSLEKGCSPFAGMILGCAYMEYFKNCPAHRWTENADCSLAKQFVTQCSLGA